MSEAKQRLSDEVDQGRQRTRSPGETEKLLSFAASSLTLTPPHLPVKNRGGDVKFSATQIGTS